MIIGFDGRYAEGDLVGIGKYIQNLVSGLIKKGVICVVFYSRKPKKEILGARTVILNSQNRYYFEQILLPIAINRNKIDIFHATGNIGVPLFSPVPIILTVHDTIPLDFKNYFSEARFPFISKISFFIRFKLSLIRASKIVTITKFTKNNLMNNYGIPASKIKVICSGINLPFGNILPKSLIKGQYIINNGGIDVRKNQERLIRAFKLIKIHFSKLKLVMTGENRSLKPKLQKLVNSLGLSQDVIFTGYVEEKVLGTLIKNSAAVVYPSLMEGFGSPVLEGFAAGVPVISSNTTSIPEISEGAALLINPLDIGEIAQAMTKVLTDKRLSERMVVKGNRVVWKYNWESSRNEYLNLYNHI